MSESSIAFRMASPKTFRSVRQAVMTYIAIKAKRGMHSLPLDKIGWDPCDPAIRDVSQATYAALVVCLESEHLPCDRDRGFGLYGRRLADLADWYVSSAERGRGSFADRMEMTTYEATMYSRFTESVIRQRLRWRGLLEEST